MFRQQLTEGQPSVRDRQERKDKPTFFPSPVTTNPASDHGSHHPSISIHGTLPFPYLPTPGKGSLSPVTHGTSKTLEQRPFDAPPSYIPSLFLP